MNIPEIKKAAECAATPEQVIEALERDKLVTPDGNVCLEGWAYTLALKCIRAQDDKLRRVGELRNELARTANSDLDRHRAEGVYLAIEKLDTILTGATQ